MCPCAWPLAAPAAAEGAKTRGTVRSYREALLKSPPKDSSNNEAEGARKRLNSSTAHVWKPSIVVQSVKHEHKDKLYQHNLAALGLPANPMYEPDEDDDECGALAPFNFILRALMSSFSKFPSAQVVGLTSSPTSSPKAP